MVDAQIYDEVRGWMISVCRRRQTVAVAMPSLPAYLSISIRRQVLNLLFSFLQRRTEVTYKSSGTSFPGQADAL